MTSNPPGSCCYAGVKHDGTASGEMKSVGDVETYFAYPEDKSTKKGLLLITDVIGHRFINVQLIADQFAANGYVSPLQLPERTNVSLSRPKLHCMY